jgi:glycosyltransferase involved in cell wall biosynthesis
VTIPLVSIITPSWQRHERLLNRCIPSVQAQAYPKVEHWVVSDGPDLSLAEKLLERTGTFTHPVHFLELAAHDPERHWGHHARLAALARAKGDLIGYVDDDDVLRPDHVRLLAKCLTEDLSIAWAYSVMQSYSSSGDWFHVGAGAGGPAFGNIGTPMIMHRRSALEHGTWGPASSMEDWELVQRWLGAGLTYGRVYEVTADVWPSAYHG